MTIQAVKQGNITGRELTLHIMQSMLNNMFSLSDFSVVEFAKKLGLNRKESDKFDELLIKNGEFLKLSEVLKVVKILGVKSIGELEGLGISVVTPSQLAEIRKSKRVESKQYLKERGLVSRRVVMSKELSDKIDTFTKSRGIKDVHGFISRTLEDSIDLKRNV